jgi:hypothetical protein
MKSKEIEVKLLQLKFLVEGLEIAKLQHVDGTQDLHFRLSHFRKKILKSNLKKFDKFFFGRSLDDNAITKAPGQIVLQGTKPQSIDLQKIDKINHPQWLKKIYRKVVQSTHPDKFENFLIENIKRKYTNIYMKTIRAWENQEYDIVLLCAYEADVDYDSKSAAKYIMQGINTRESKIKDIKKTMAYNWYHVQQDRRSIVLENHLRQLGYEFTTEEVEEVVKLARKRKAGTRPENLRNRKKIL